jgi:hypothetical protein
MKQLLIALFLFTLIPAFSGPLNTAAAQSLEHMTHEELNAELVKRWDETKLPDFLESKKSMIDEVMESGMHVDPTLLRELLASDAETKIVKNSSLVNPAIYSSLQTQSSSKYLLRNLKEGKLVPRENPQHHSRYGIYLELHLVSNPRHFDWGDVELHFDNSLLDRSDYHINPSWAYGNYDPLSASPAVNMGRTNYFIRKLLGVAADAKNEVVFHNEVPLSALVRIFVPTGQKQKLMQEIAEQGIPCPVAMGWGELLAEKEKPKPAKKE